LSTRLQDPKVEFFSIDKTSLKHGLIGTRSHSLRFKIMRFLVFTYLLVGLLFVLVKRKGKYVLKWPKLLYGALAIYKP